MPFEGFYGIICHKGVNPPDTGTLWLGWNFCTQKQMSYKITNNKNQKIYMLCEFCGGRPQIRSLAKISSFCPPPKNICRVKCIVYSKIQMSTFHLSERSFRNKALLKDGQKYIRYLFLLKRRDYVYANYKN